MLIYLIPSCILFVIGAFGMFLIRKHIIIILISFELLLLSININFISASIFIDDLQGQIISLSVPTVAASESALGLALSIVYYRLRGGISLDPINSS